MRHPFVDKVFDCSIIKYLLDRTHSAVGGVTAGQ